jgi:MFS family permease
MKNNFFQKIDDKHIRTGLKYAISDGILWAIMFGFAENFLVPFALVFSASAFQVSLIQGSAQLGVGIAQLLGARFIIKFRQRKKMTIFTSRIQALSWIMVFFITLWLKSPWVILIFYFTGLFVANFSGPGWLSWMNDLVPQKYRGEYWGLRNKAIGFTQFAAIAMGGVLLYFARKVDRELLAFGFLFCCAFAARFANFIPLGKQYEPPMLINDSGSQYKFQIFLGKLFTTNFGRFALFSVLMTFAINFMAPLIPVYVLKTLQFNYLQFTIITMMPIVASFIFFTYWGRLADIYGNYRILLVTSVAIPLIALLWSFLTHFPSLILLQAFSGFVFAGFNLSTINFIFDAVRRENISKIGAFFNTLNTSCIFLGALAGGLTVKFLGKVDVSRFLSLNTFTAVFLISALIRLIIVLFFIRRFKEVRKVESAPPLHHFYIYKPAANIFNRFQLIGERFLRTDNPEAVPRES